MRISVMKMNRKWLLGLNEFIIVYFILFLIWTEAPLPEEGSEVSFNAYGGIFAVVNPFTIGSYLIGIVALLNLKFIRSRIYRTVFFIIYLFIAFCSLVATMGMTYWWELLIYLPHLFTIIGCAVIIFRRIEIKG